MPRHRDAFRGRRFFLKYGNFKAQFMLAAAKERHSKYYILLILLLFFIVCARKSYAYLTVLMSAVGTQERIFYEFTAAF